MSDPEIKKTENRYGLRYVTIPEGLMPVFLLCVDRKGKHTEYRFSFSEDKDESGMGAEPTRERILSEPDSSGCSGQLGHPDPTGEKGCVPTD